MSQKELSQDLQERVLQACAQKTPLVISGGGSKAFYGRPCTGEPLDVAGHTGILNYEPTELVLTACAGTKLKDIEALLAREGQMLGFEPPHYGEAATLGGTIATGLSGSRRPYAGAARDAVLGVKIINGHGEILKFGGEVMKNVAGFDVSRLMVGAMGTLGVLLDISMKVLPMPEAELTLAFEMDTSAAISTMNQWIRQNVPLCAACFDGAVLRIRLSGAEAVLKQVRQRLGGEALATDDATAFWQSVREHTHEFFQDGKPLWRLSMPPASPQPDLDGAWFIDWGGALRWLKTGQANEAIFNAAKQSGGHACRFRAPEGSLFQPLPDAVAALNRKIKHSFDPHGLFNAGRLYEGW